MSLAHPHRRVEPAPAAIRFWGYVKVMPSGCWEWQASLDGKGYGQFNPDGHMVRAHRWVYERAFGKIPSPKLFVMHTCDNPKCVRLSHLRLGTRSDNVRDMLSKGRGNHPWGKRMHCSLGHEYTPANTHRDKKGRRVCRTCRYTKQQERRRVLQPERKKYSPRRSIEARRALGLPFPQREYPEVPMN